jgi:hypothetical protein
MEKHTSLLRSLHVGSPSRTELFLDSGKSVGRQPCTLMTPAPLRAAWGGSGTSQTWFSDKAPDERTGKRTSSGSSSSGCSSAGSSTAGASLASITCSSWGASACRVPTRDEKKVEMLMVVCSAAVTIVRNSVDRHVAAVAEFRRRFGNLHPSTTPTHPSPPVLLLAPFPHKAQ